MYALTDLPCFSPIPLFFEGVPSFLLFSLHCAAAYVECVYV